MVNAMGTASTGINPRVEPVPTVPIAVLLQDLSDDANLELCQTRLTHGQRAQGVVRRWWGANGDTVFLGIVIGVVGGAVWAIVSKAGPVQKRQSRDGSSFVCVRACAAASCDNCDNCTLYIFVHCTGVELP